MTMRIRLRCGINCIIARIQEKSLDFSQSFISSLPIIERHWAKEKKRRGDVKP
jgi:hypothetical protein